MSTAVSTTGNGPFFVHIEGLPSNYDWRDLKDLIRAVARHGLWTDMALQSNGQPSGTGLARVQRSEEAVDVYNFLIGYRNFGRTLNVHLWDISDNRTQARFVGCNCPGSSNDHLVSHEVMRELPRLARNTSSWRDFQPHGHANPPVPVYAQHPQLQYAQSLMSYAAQPSTPFFLPQQMPGSAITQANPSYARQAQHSPISTSVAQQTSYATGYPQAVYVPTSSGLPVNIGEGFARTESRGIFVSDLIYTATERDIRRDFGSIGPIVNLQMPRSGVAIIHYNTAAEAQAAVDRFNSRAWRGRVLNVRLDTNRTTVSGPSRSSPPRQRRGNNGTPTIVNGSNGQSSQAQGRL